MQDPFIFLNLKHFTPSEIVSQEAVLVNLSTNSTHVCLSGIKHAMTDHCIFHSQSSKPSQADPNVRKFVGSLVVGFQYHPRTGQLDKIERILTGP